MLRPVLPYSIVGLALGSLVKSPGAGAVLGTVVGIGRTSRGSDSPEYGWLPIFRGSAPSTTPSYGPAPSSTPDAKTARLAAAHAIFKSDPKQAARYGTPLTMSRYTGGSGIPWKGESTVSGIIRSTLRGQYKLKVTQRAYLIGLLGKARTREALSASRSPVSPPAARARAVAKVRSAAKKSEAATVAPAGASSDFTVPQAQDPKTWISTRQGKIAISAMAGVGALVVILLLLRKRK